MKNIIIAVILSALLPFSADAARVRVAAPEKAPVGQPFFVEMRTDEDLGAVALTWRGKRFDLLPRYNAVRAVLGFPNDAKLVGTSETLTLEFVSEGKTVAVERSVKALPFDYPKQELKVAPKMVNPPQSESERIARERKIVTKALAAQTKGAPAPKKLFRPVKGIPTGYFGGFRVFNGVPRSGHGGLDLRAAVGTKVKAAADGTVVLTGNHYFSGVCVYLDHGGGLMTFYCHLSKALVQQGQRVKAGDVIALSGATGRVTGPHLHLGVYAGGAWLDALPLLGEAALPVGVDTVEEY